MSAASSTNGNYPITLYLIVHKNDNYVNPSIYIDIPKDENIKLDKIETIAGTVTKDDTDMGQGSITTITYKTYSDKNAGFLFHDSNHNLPGLPHEINVVVNPGADGASSVKDIAL
ncbi:MAG: hypothetical protein B6D61_02625 [Bacteroidetes bacterium 4484_249]|nr:MAG: hypothetical protein B6D61_02625 [Bacteroidetes bacterium 4484_249]